MGCDKSCFSSPPNDKTHQSASIAPYFILDSRQKSVQLTIPYDVLYSTMPSGGAS